jgi:putative salt-induced outer membrane protein YdiY
MRIFLFFLYCGLSFSLFSQNDTISLKNGIYIYGEIKNIQSNILTLETSYSDSDFKIDFKEVTGIKIQKICFILLTRGRRKTGYISSNTPNYFTITSQENIKETHKLSDLISLNELSDKFLDRMTFNIDFSYNLTKANKTSQFVTEGNLNYRDLKWILNSSFSALNSQQDNIDDIQRTEIKADIKRILPKKWYLLSNFGFFSNTEQAIESRYTISTGIGRYLLFTQKLSLGLNFGINFNIEKFDDATEKNSSSELYLGSEFDMFDFDDFKLITTINLFFSNGDSRRVRADYNINIQFDLPLDLYIKTGFKYNYDSQSAITGSSSDYLFTSGVGWSFN